MELRCYRYHRTAAFDLLAEIFCEDFRDLLARTTDPTSASLPNQDGIDSSQLASYHHLDIPLRFSVEYLMTVGGVCVGGGAVYRTPRAPNSRAGYRTAEKEKLRRKVFPGSLRMAPYRRIWQVQGSKSDVYSSALCCIHVLSEAAMKETCVRCLAVNLLAKW